MKLLFIILFTSSLVSQNIVVKNSQSSASISYATILYKADNSIIDFDYTNENGIFTLNSKAKYDSITFKCLGFKTLNIHKSEILNTVFLEEEVFLLNEIIITNSNKTKILGLINEKKKVSIGISKGLEICLFFENNDTFEKQIKSFLFHMNYRTKKRHAIRLHMYDISKTSFEPGDEILTENIVQVLDTQSHTLVSIDLTSHQVFLPPEGAFIGIEFLEFTAPEDNIFSDTASKQNNCQIHFNDKTNKSYTFIRNVTKKDSWGNTLKNDLKSYLKFKNVPNASFGIEIYD